MTIRVAVVDDQEIVRAGFAALLGTQEDFLVVGTAADGQEAVELCGRDRPHVVLMDVRMPVVDGIEATRRVTANGKRTPRVIMLTTFDLDEYVYDALGAGASGFLLKDVTAETLFDAVRVVAAGDALLAPAVTRRLVAEFARLRPTLPSRPDALSELTPRETEVLRLVAEGLSNGEIAERLVVSDETVKTHVSRILSKLDVRDRTQAVVVAYDPGSSRRARANPRREPPRLTTRSGGREALPRRLATEPRVHGRAHVRELALLVDPPGRVPPGRVREQQRVLP